METKRNGYPVNLVQALVEFDKREAQRERQIADSIFEQQRNNDYLLAK